MNYYRFDRLINENITDYYRRARQLVDNGKVVFNTKDKIYVIPNKRKIEYEDGSFEFVTGLIVIDGTITDENAILLENVKE